MRYHAHMNEIADILGRVMKAAELKQTAFARRIGVGQSTISRWRRGQEPESENWDKVIEVGKQHGVPVPALEDILHPLWQVEVLGYIGAGAEVLPIDNGVLDEVSVNFRVAPGTKAAIVRGSSMHPIFEDGDLIGFSAETLSPDQAIGKICVVLVEDGRMMVKRVIYGSAPGLFTLQSTNMESIQDVRLLWARRFEFRVIRDMWQGK